MIRKSSRVRHGSLKSASRGRVAAGARRIPAPPPPFPSVTETDPFGGYDPTEFGPQHILPNRRRVALGWLPDLPDLRDTTLSRLAPKFALPLERGSSRKNGTAAVIQSVPVAASAQAHQRVAAGFRRIRAETLPSRVDNHEFCSPIEDQGPLGSCTAQAGVGLIEYMERRATGLHLDASRLFLYKVTRNLLGWNGDTGAFLRTTMKALVLFGAPPEQEWPYAVNRFDLEPDGYLYAYASNYRAIQYLRLDPPEQTRDQTLTSIKTALQLGYVAMFGFAVYSSLDNSGLIPFPSNTDREVGGHAVLAVGYDDSIQCPNAPQKGALLIRNSWGTEWGGDPDQGVPGGYGWLPYSYVTEGLADDFWTAFSINWVESGQFD